MASLFSKCFNKTSQSLKIKSVLELTVPNCQEMGLYFFSSFSGSYKNEGKGSVSLQIMVYPSDTHYNSYIHLIHTVIHIQTEISEILKNLQALHTFRLKKVFK